MELLLIRHARPHRLEAVEGPADPALDGLGLAQADALAAWLAADGIDALYSSPLRRAVETAAPIGARLGLEARLADGVAEWDRDAPAYIPVEELKATNHPWWDAMANGRWDELGVDPEVFAGRVESTLATIAADHPGQRVAVVCHGGVVNAYVAGVLGLRDLLFFEPDYTSISRVLVARSGRRSLVSLNETGHLRAL